MKQTNMAIGSTFLLLIILTSLPYSRAEHKPTGVVDVVHWMNPDGSKGIAVVSGASKRTLAWGNPDGTTAFVKQHSTSEPAFAYAWANPDGYRSPSMKALNGGDHAGSTKLTTKLTEVARYNAQLHQEVTKGDGPMKMLRLSVTLAAGVMLLLLRVVWPK
jgi:hypothetical protein